VSTAKKIRIREVLASKIISDIIRATKGVCEGVQSKIDSTAQELAIPEQTETADVAKLIVDSNKA
jgi:hypothetical protein